MITLPLTALVRRPAPASAPAAADDADAGAPSFGDVFDRARQTPEAPVARTAHDVPGEQHAADPAAHGQRPEPAPRPGVSERRFGHDRPASTDGASAGTTPEQTATDGPTAATAADTDTETETETDAAHDADSPGASPAAIAQPKPASVLPGAITVPTDGAAQLAAATGLAAAGVVQVSNTDGPVAPAGLHAADPAMASLAPLTDQPDTTAPTAAAPAPDGPVITGLQVETVRVEPAPVPGAPATATTEPTAATATDTTTPPMTSAGSTPAATPDATPAPLPASPETLATQAAAAPADPARSTSAPAAPQAAPAPVTSATTATAAAAAATDTAPTADRAPAAARPAAANDAPSRAEAPTPTAPQSAPARAADVTGAAAAPADGVVPSRIVDLVERAQRETQIRRAEHTTRIGMDIATEGLGAIRIDASNSGAGLHLNLGADRQATRQLLADQVNVLRDELGGASVSVDLGHSSAGRHDTGDEPHDRVASSASSTVPLTATQRPSRPSALRSLLGDERGVDLHL